MNKFEELFEEGKANVERLSVPDELEIRLRSALTSRRAPRRPLERWKVSIAVILVAFSLIAYNYDALAYYGKQLLGYDQIMNGTLKQLNTLGKGQSIGKSYTFKNGFTLTLDGVMLDSNQLLLFSTLKAPAGELEHGDMTPMMTIKGLFGEYMENNSTGQISADNTEIKSVTSFAPPKFFEKNLTLTVSITDKGTTDRGNITFTLNRNTAMGYTLKKNINETFNVDGNKIHIDSLLASPTKTVIEGSVMNILELAEAKLSGEEHLKHISLNSFDLRLYANDKEVAIQGGGMGTNFHGITFNEDYDALPTDLQKLEIKLVSLGADHQVNKSFNLKIGSDNSALNILGQTIEIKKVYTSGGDTYITLSSEDGVVLTKVYLLMDGKQVSLNDTQNDRYDKIMEGKSDKVIHTRTLHFPGTGQNLELDVQRMTYVKTYNEVLNIPLK
ncbi:hypothetical protein DEAC_c00230 [Desulfosporosinus acididurans]|uniref:DUF4179 domain-containing protein n=1 Tax=Desulfosporosinus acididurans TaxID=476652 RepID=A0A0J1FW28_9FIRM|nr:DUF4179 domain-containing protein [Desulfosporosinus acididurans]KLU67629.1 hypothetical protein DEAC_c00230 [Desulfosporosinus acididurans]